MWELRSDLGNGEWNALYVDTEAEALAWWNTQTGVRVSPSQTRVLTLTNPDGEVVQTYSN